MQQSVEIVEVSPRDGLQSRSTVLATEDEVRLVERAVDAVLRRIAAVSPVGT